jgi:hypothetical protein
MSQLICNRPQLWKAGGSGSGWTTSGAHETVRRDRQDFSLDISFVIRQNSGGPELLYSMTPPPSLKAGGLEPVDREDEGIAVVAMLRGALNMDYLIFQQ